MEPKKHASKDLHAQRKKFFLIGLSLSLMLVITAFEWTTVKKITQKPTEIVDVADIPYIVPVTTQTVTPPEVNKQNMKVDIKPLVPIEIVVAKDPMDDDPRHSPIDNLAPIDDAPIAISPMEPEGEMEIVVFPERNAEPVGGYKNFYETIAKNLRYPMQASRTGTEGKVYVQFVVDKLGQPTDFKILRGIGAGCDEEAVRVVQSAPAWNPGKQRGKAVRQRYTIPINFKLG